jgi:ligand-binding sensor domain-containing protein
LPANSIQSLLAASDGSVWVGTAQGICRYDKTRNCFKRIAARIKGRMVFGQENHAFLEDAKHTVWAGTGLGLLRYNPKDDCFEQTLDDLPVNANRMVTSIAEEKDGTFWILNYETLLHFDPVSRRCQEFENVLPDKKKFQGLKVLVDRNTGAVWITTWGCGFVHFDKEKRVFTSFLSGQMGHPTLTTSYSTDASLTLRGTGLVPTKDS